MLTIAIDSCQHNSPGDRILRPALVPITLDIKREESLVLDSEGAVVEFAKQRGWALEEGRIYFPGVEAEKDLSGHEGDQKEIISNMIGYARDLEMIV